MFAFFKTALSFHIMWSGLAITIAIGSKEEAMLNYYNNNIVKYTLCVLLLKPSEWVEYEYHAYNFLCHFLLLYEVFYPLFRHFLSPKLYAGVCHH